MVKKLFFAKIFLKRLTNAWERVTIIHVKTSSVVWFFTESPSLAARRIKTGEGETALRSSKKQDKSGRGISAAIKVEPREKEFASLNSH